MFIIKTSKYAHALLGEKSIKYLWQTAIGIIFFNKILNLYIFRLVKKSIVSKNVVTIYNLKHGRV